MPSVVRRGRGEPFQKPFLERKIALETACGAFAPSRVATTFPHVVAIVSCQLLPAPSVLGGAVLHDFGVAGAVTVGVGHGLAAFEAPADADGAEVADAAGEAAVVLVRRSRAAPIATAKTTMTVRPIAMALRWARRRAATRSCCLDAHFSYRRLAYSRSRLLGVTCPPEVHSPGVHLPAVQCQRLTA